MVVIYMIDDTYNCEIIVCKFKLLYLIMYTFFNVLIEIKKKTKIYLKQFIS